MSISLPAWKCLRYEIAINGVQILRRAVNDFSLWRLIEYPRTARWVEAEPGDLILDIGSGTSSFGLMLAREGARVVVLDLSPERVAWQREKAQAAFGNPVGSILPIVADATALPFCDGAFQRVTSVSALEHVPDDARAASELGRVLDVEGLAVVSLAYTFEERKTFFEGVKRFDRVEKNRFVQQNKGGYQIRFYNDADLQSRFAGPARSRIDRVSYFGRKILNDWYHETRLNRYWFSFILKDYLLAAIIYPFEEMFLRGTEPFGVIFRLRKDRV